MIFTYQRLLTILGAVSLAAISTAVVAADPPAKEPAERKIVWDTEALFATPKTQATDESPAKGLKSLFYEGANYKGKPTWVFAYYGTPEGETPKDGWPAVVCAHGGGGTAYPDWVRSWNQRGYAAIAMDLEGHLPGGGEHGLEGNLPKNRAHENAGPARVDYFGDRDLPDTEKWFYQAVADVIRANSLLRSLPEINKQKVGLTGISWGGTVASTAAGVDPRFAFAVPVYGAGFIHESDNPGLSQWFPPTNMTAEQFADYKTKWDPSAHLPHAKMPLLFVSSVADPVFQVDVFAKSSAAAGGPSSLCLRPFLIHAHGAGWEDVPEIIDFADSIVKDAKALPLLEEPKLDAESRTITTSYTGDITEAWVYFTTSDAKFKDRKWNFIECTRGEKDLVSKQPLPKETTAFLVYGFRVGDGGHRTNHASSPLVLKP